MIRNFSTPKVVHLEGQVAPTFQSKVHEQRDTESPKQVLQCVEKGERETRKREERKREGRKRRDFGGKVKFGVRYRNLGF